MDKCATCVPNMGRDEPKDARFEGRQYGSQKTELFCSDCVEAFASSAGLKSL